jgi:hypothetical protein
MEEDQACIPLAFHPMCDAKAHFQRKWKRTGFVTSSQPA